MTERMRRPVPLRETKIDDIVQSSLRKKAAHESMTPEERAEQDAKWAKVFAKCTPLSFVNDEEGDSE